MIKSLRPSYSGYAKDDFYVLYSQYFFQTTHDRYLFSKIRLDLFPTLYNFIVWACWTKTQSCLGSKPKPVLTIGTVCREELDLIWGDSNLALKMEESGSHQPTIGPHQDDANLHQAESGDSQHNNSVANPQRRGGNLTQHFVHDIIPKAFMGWALILILMAILLIARESLTGRSSGSSPICSIICLLGGSELGDECLRRTRRNFFFNSSISRCMSLSLFAWETWLFPRDWLLLVCVVCILPLWSPLCWGFATELLCWEPPDSAWCRLASSWCGPIVGWCEPDSSISNAKPESPSDQIKFSPQTVSIVRTSFGLDPK